MPDVVALPPSRLEETLQDHEAGLRGGHTTHPSGRANGLVSGGALPVAGGVLLSLMRMNKVLEIDEKNMQVVVEPGVVAADLQATLTEHKPLLPAPTLQAQSRAPWAATWPKTPAIPAQ